MFYIIHAICRPHFIIKMCKQFLGLIHKQTTKIYTVICRRSLRDMFFYFVRECRKKLNFLNSSLEHITLGIYLQHQRVKKCHKWELNKTSHQRTVTTYILKISAKLQHKVQQQCCPILLHIKFRNTLGEIGIWKHTHSGCPNNQSLCTNFKNVFCKTITANGETICIWLSFMIQKDRTTIIQSHNIIHYSIYNY